MEWFITNYFIDCFDFNLYFVVGLSLHLLVVLKSADFVHAIAVKITFFIYSNLNNYKAFYIKQMPYKKLKNILIFTLGDTY